MNRSQKARFRSGFTLLEILVVLGLIGVLIYVAATHFGGDRGRVKSAGYQLTRDVEGLAIKAIKTGKVYRLSFADDRQNYSISEFQGPMPKPAETDKDAFKKWEDAQKAYQDLSVEKKEEMTQLDRGTFKNVKTQSFPSAVYVKNFYSSRQSLDSQSADTKDNQTWDILFYPTGETDSVLIVLSDSSNNSISLQLSPLTGKLAASPGEINEQEWKESSRPK